MKLKSAINIKGLSGFSIGYRFYVANYGSVLREPYLFCVLVILTVLLTSCHDRKSSGIIENPIGYTVSFPTTLKPVHKDKFCQTPAEFTILTYNNEENCMGCAMRLMSWEEFMDSVETVVPTGRVTLLIISESKNEKALWALKRRSDFHHEILIDIDNNFAHINADIIDNELKSRTFLLDSENRVVYYGSPLDDPDVRKEYYSFLIDEKHNSQSHSKK